ncbi:hypothetical protein EDC96DRAFT_580117 [Choanephora cucurbitarum]|nr:hypothetical protein EDC96DRAFT_580117 [Choanephora cucurbitarum]
MARRRLTEEERAENERVRKRVRRSIPVLRERDNARRRQTYRERGRQTYRERGRQTYRERIQRKPLLEGLEAKSKKVQLLCVFAANAFGFVHRLQTLKGPIDDIQLNEAEYEGSSDSNSEDDDLFDDLPVGSEESLLCSDNFLKIAPGEGSSALSLMRDEYVDFLAFPKIYAGHALEPKVNNKPMTYSAFTKSIIRRADRRGVIRDYLFFMDRKKLLLSLISNTNIMMRKSSCSRLTAGDALNNFLVNNLIKTD